VFAVMTTWRRGQRIVSDRRKREAGSLRDFVHDAPALDPAVRNVRGTAVFLNADPGATPLALHANVEHNHVLHENVIAMSIVTDGVPHVAAQKRLAVDHLGDTRDGIVQLTARFGFLDRQNVPAALRLAVRHGLLEREVDADTTSYFVSRTVLVRTGAPGMTAWRKALYVTIAHNAASPVELFCLPHGRTVIMGQEIEI
jgi:KUP system potassium uptake protein